MRPASSDAHRMHLQSLDHASTYCVSCGASYCSLLCFSLFESLCFLLFVLLLLLCFLLWFLVFFFFCSKTTKVCVVLLQNYKSVGWEMV